MTYNWVPYNTDDTQYEANAYAQVVWKHTFDEHSFLQLDPTTNIPWFGSTTIPSTI